MRTLANSKDPYEMLHKHCIMVYTGSYSNNDMQRKKYSYFIFEILTDDPSLFNPKSIVLYKKKEFISI